MAVGEMAFAQEEENGMGGVWSTRDPVEEGGGSGSASSDGSRSATTRAHRPRAGERGHSKQGGGVLMCGPHGTVPVGRVKRRSIIFKINSN
jgi:hypothetical protein